MDKTPKQEQYVYVTAASGRTVRIPASKLEAWKRGQEEVRNGTYKPKKQELDAMKRAIDDLAGRAQQK